MVCAQHSLAYGFKVVRRVLKAALFWEMEVAATSYNNSQ
jgi:hypothetical protein